MLCLDEKLAIALDKKDKILNKRTEIITKCRHSIKYNSITPKTNTKSAIKFTS